MPRTFRLSELARLGPCKRSKLYVEIREGRLRAHKAGSSTFVYEADWLAFLETLPRLMPRTGPQQVPSPGAERDALKPSHLPRRRKELQRNPPRLAGAP
jgi:hypothetical protein